MIALQCTRVSPAVPASTERAKFTSYLPLCGALGEVTYRRKGASKRASDQSEGVMWRRAHSIWHFVKSLAIGVFEGGVADYDDDFVYMTLSIAGTYNHLECRLRLYQYDVLFLHFSSNGDYARVE